MTKQSPMIQTIKNKSLIITSGALLLFLAVFFTFGVFITAFSFQVNMWGLYRIWLPCSILLSAFTTLYRWKGILTLVLPYLLVLYIRFEEIIEGAKWVVYSITEYYSRWLSVTVLFPESQRYTDDPAFFFVTAGIAVLFLLSEAVCLRRSVLFTVLFTAPIVFLTFVITDSVADIIYMLGLIVVYMTLLISSAMGSDNYVKRALVSIPSFTLAITFALIVYVLVLPGRYERDAQIITIGNHLRSIVTELRQLGPPEPVINNRGLGWPNRSTGSIWMFNTGSVSIADAGERVITDINLLEITSSAPGTFYLRGFTNDVFDGRSWRTSEGYVIAYFDEDSWLTFDVSEALGLYADRAREMPAVIAQMGYIFEDAARPLTGMNIRKTGDITNIDYIPYYSGVALDFEIEGAVPHQYDSSLNLYDYNFYNIQQPIHRIWDAIQGQARVSINRATMEAVILATDTTQVTTDIINELVNEGVYSYTIFPHTYLDEYTSIVNRTRMYTEVDYSTARGLRQLAVGAGIDTSADRAQIVDAVARYIRSSGTYTLTPEVLPEDEDFALYFLQTQREGYCIHFATAAVLMLRSLDIPARFVSGFVVTVPPGSVDRPIILTDRNAHAWVEVFYEDVGWLYLEATPSSTASVVPSARPHNPESFIDNTPPPRQEPDVITTTVETNGADNQQQTGVGEGTETRRTLNIPAWAINIIIIIAWIVMGIIMLHMRIYILRKLRTRRFKQANTNTAVIYMWRYILRLGRREIVPPTDIEELALKARFSHHKISENERTMMVKYAGRLADEIYRSKDGFGQIWLKYIRGLC